MTVRLARTVVVAHHMVTATLALHTVTVTIVRLAATVLHMVVMTVLHVVTMSVLLVLGVHAMIVRLAAVTVQPMVVQVRQRVAATLVK
jgi:tellurite resistance protein TehA-like permease